MTAISNNANQHDARQVIILLFFLMLAVHLIRIVQTKLHSPNDQQLIAATLISWGIQNLNLQPRVNEKEIQNHIENLSSPITEERVKAGYWLAERGIRDASRYIADAMVDERTRRPCQLAKSLGALGNKMYASPLVDAAKQDHNADLRVCATIALGELQAQNTTDALIDVYRSNDAPVSALTSLGKIADPRALDFLYSVAQTPRNEHEQSAALKAIERTIIMMRPDPIPLLIRRVNTATKKRLVDEWAVRKLAIKQDHRAISVLRDAYRYLHDDDRHGQRIIAAALLAHRDAGIQSLRILKSRIQHSTSKYEVIEQSLLLTGGSSQISKRLFAQQ